MKKKKEITKTIEDLDHISPKQFMEIVKKSDVIITSNGTRFGMAIETSRKWEVGMHSKSFKRDFVRGNKYPFKEAFKKDSGAVFRLTTSAYFHTVCFLVP